jgi:hypothetical protein
MAGTATSRPSVGAHCQTFPRTRKAPTPQSACTESGMAHPQDSS